jgi:hypothetical protein
MPQTRYNVIECNTNEVVTQCSDEYEADSTVAQLVDVNPNKQYKVVAVEVYDSDAFRYGRDPELH